MAFAVIGFKTLTHIGALEAGVGSLLSAHSYVTNDAAAAVETSGYFDTIASRIKTGDQLTVSLDLDGTPALKQYVMINTSGVITLTAAAA